MLVIDSMSELSELINSCGKEITHLKSLLQFNAVLKNADIKLISVIACFVRSVQ